MAALRASPKFAAPITATTYAVIVVRIDFSDQIMTKTQAQADTFMANLKAFYTENSYGLLTVNATTTGNGAGGQGAYRMPKTLAYYANGLSSKYSEIARDAIALATAAGTSFAGYNHIMIYHAGAGAETSSSPSSLIWSAYAPASLVNGPSVGAKTFPGATFVPETELQSVDPLGVICHEYGHQQGLPDLYDTNTGNSRVGSWSLMDSGVYIGSPQGSNPAHFDAWSKQFLGFSSPETLSSSNGISRTLTQAETSRSSFVRIPIPVSSVSGGEANEYFLLEYRRTSGATYDTALRGQGVLIWHVDDSIMLNQTRSDNNNVNIGTPNLGLDLVESGATDTSTSGGSSADPWPGTTATFQSPKNSAYNGKDSGIVVSGISSPGNAAVSLTIQSSFSNPALSSATTVAVASSGNTGYFNPNNGESAVIGITPVTSGNVDIKVYSLNADLVYETTLAGVGGSLSRVTWDGKNKDGKIVSSGIYVIHVNGGGIDMKKKTALIR